MKIVSIESVPTFHYPGIWEDRDFKKTGSTYRWRYDGTRLILAQCCDIDRANQSPPRLAVNETNIIDL